MRRILTVVLAMSVCAAVAAAETTSREAGFIAGMEVGVAVPVNDNYWAHVHEGATASPFLGYMLSDHFGILGQMHLTVHSPDDDGRGIPDEDDATTLLGLGFGPRVSLPLTDRFHVFFVGQGGFLSGLSGRVNETDFAVNAGGGLDLYVTDQIVLTAFSRFHYSFLEPFPHRLGPPHTGGFGQVEEDQGPERIRWVTGGIGMRYDFRKPAEPLPAPQPVVEYKPVPIPIVEPKPLPPVKKRRVVLHSIFFDFNRSELHGPGMATLAEAARALRNDEPHALITVEGHTDHVGSDAFNLRLGQRRAKAVYQYLVARGVSPQRLTVRSFGERRPMASNETEEGRAQNRRVVLDVH